MTESLEAGREPMTDLTLARLRETLASFEDAQAANDADSFVRLGSERYKGYRILKHGGYVLVGGEERPDNRGPQIVAEIQRLAPNVRIHLTSLLPEGEIYLVDDSRFVFPPV